MLKVYKRKIFRQEIPVSMPSVFTKDGLLTPVDFLPKDNHDMVDVDPCDVLDCGMQLPKGNIDQVNNVPIETFAAQESFASGMLETYEELKDNGILIETPTMKAKRIAKTPKVVEQPKADSDNSNK